MPFFRYVLNICQLFQIISLAMAAKGVSFSGAADTPELFQLSENDDN